MKEIDENVENNMPIQEREEDEKNPVWAGIRIALCSLVGVILVGIFVLVICGFQFFYVLTGSMSPTISAGETVLVNTNVDKDNLQVGDIITFKRGNLTVTHRIIEVVKNADGSVHHYVQCEDYKYRIEVKGETFEGVNVSSLTQGGNVDPKDVLGTVVCFGEDKPVKLIIIGAIMKLFQGSNSILQFVKIAIVIAIVILASWCIFSYVRGKRQRE